MGTTKCVGLAAAAFAWVVVGETGIASAQVGEGNEAGVFEGAGVESEAPGEDLERKIRALRWGVATSTVAIPLGLGMFAGGAAACVGSSLFSSQNCTRGQIALQGAGIALMVAGTAGMIASAILLRRRKKEQMGLHAKRRLHWNDSAGAFAF